MNIEPLKTYYHHQSPRDQLALKVLSGFLSISLLIFVVYLPTRDYYFEARQAFLDQTELLTWMEQNRDNIQINTEGPGIPDPNASSLLNLVSDAAEIHQISITRYQNQRDNTLQLWLTKVEFNLLVAWLNDLNHNGAVQIQDVSMTKSEQPGFVDAQIVLGD